MKRTYRDLQESKTASNQIERGAEALAGPPGGSETAFDRFRRGVYNNAGSNSTNDITSQLSTTKFAKYFPNTSQASVNQRQGSVFPSTFPEAMKRLQTPMVKERDDVNTVKTVKYMAPPQQFKSISTDAPTGAPLVRVFEPPQVRSICIFDL